MPKSPFIPCPSLLTDYYQLTMSYGYWKAGRAELPAVFTLFFRTNPFGGGYCLAAGLESASNYLEAFRFGEDELAFIGSLQKPDGSARFEPAFLEFLRKSRFECDVQAVPEGSVLFPHEPVLKVRGPIWQCQWIETALLNVINFQSLIATKAARIVAAAKGGEVVDFGLRRAQGFDGGLSASRAAYIGGVSATSNLLAAKLYGIPLRGTHAHSWIMSFNSEREAFEAYAETMPDECVLLVDTFDTLSGIRHAVEVGKKMRDRGHRLAGIRLDSGDFAYLSVEARRLLDEARLEDVRIVASNELDEHLIQSLHFQNSRIDVWGVGTKLVTAHDQSAMNGVYKLAAVKEQGEWRYKIKVSDQPAKISNPGLHETVRFYNRNGQMEGDLILDEDEKLENVSRIVDPLHPLRFKKIRPEWEPRSLLREIFRRGEKIWNAPALEKVREYAREDLSKLHEGCRRLENPHVYPVGLSPYLSKLKADLIHKHMEERARE